MKKRLIRFCFYFSGCLVGGFLANLIMPRMGIDITQILILSFILSML